MRRFVLAVALAACPKPAPKPAGPPQAPVRHPSGLVTQVLIPGDGDRAGQGDKIQVHFVGSVLDGGVFDSSRARGAPFSFWLGERQVIAGWDEGLRGIPEGETRRLVVPPDLGYGSEPKPGIPANSTLVFDIELLDVR